MQLITEKPILELNIDPYLQEDCGTSSMVKHVSPMYEVWQSFPS